MVPPQSPDGRLRVGGWVRDPDLAQLMPDPQPAEPPQPQAAALAVTEADGAGGDAEPLDAGPPDLDDGHGGRRPATDRGSRRHWSLRRWLIPAAVLVLAGLVITGGLLLVPPNTPHGDADPPGGELPAGPLGQPSPLDSASPADPVASAGPVRPSSVPPSRPPSASRSASLPPFQPFTVDAENSRNTLGGSAEITSYDGASGGEVVYRLGDWGRGAPGTLTVPVTVPSAGAYTLSFSYVHPDGEDTRSVNISISGAAPIVLSTTAGTDCCETASVKVTLRAGANTISFGNPNGHAPAIDRIQLTR